MRNEGLVRVPWTIPMIALMATVLTAFALPALAQCDFDGDGQPDRDLDGDGHVDNACGGDDCDDDDPRRFPGNQEVCDDVDDDCDPGTIGSKDFDGDGYDDARCCNLDNCGNDCDDERIGIHPAATEVCDDRDNDCDTAIDEGVGVDVYRDNDEDGYGDPAEARFSCAGRRFLTTRANDCDDSNPFVRPGTMTCASDGGAEIIICEGDGSSTVEACPAGEVCRSQPNGTGICDSVPSGEPL